MGASNRLTLSCKRDASSECMRLGAVAALCRLLSTILPSSVATVKRHLPRSLRSIVSICFFINRCTTTNPDGVVHSSSVTPRLIALDTSSSIHFITDIGPGTTRDIASLTALTVIVRSSLSTSIPFSLRASLMYCLLLNALAL